MAENAPEMPITPEKYRQVTPTTPVLRADDDDDDGSCLWRRLEMNDSGGLFICFIRLLFFYGDERRRLEPLL